MFKYLLKHVKHICNRNLYNMSQINNGQHTLTSNTNNGFFDSEVSRMVWIDMEMTGLNVDKDKIMEIACIITDSNLNVIAEGPDIIINQPETLLNSMDHWCTKQHGKTGLTAASLKSTVSTSVAEDIILEFVSTYVAENMCPLVGNSVYMDRLFLLKYMPKLNSYLHYRIIDVSTVKELCRLWNLDLYKTVPKKEYTHRALSDVRESIKELKFYKENFLKISL